MFLLYKEGTEEIPIKYTQKALLSESDSSAFLAMALWYVMKKKFAGKGQPAIAAASASAKSSSKPKKARDVSQKDPTQPKKKNRKRVAERLAAEEAAKKQQNDDAE